MSLGVIFTCINFRIRIIYLNYIKLSNLLIYHCVQCIIFLYFFYMNYITKLFKLMSVFDIGPHLAKVSEIKSVRDDS